MSFDSIGMATMTEKPVLRSEILNIAEYEKARPEFRRHVIALKEHRRVGVGPYFTFLFENHDTVRYQIQEMMRVERIVDERAIEHEIETYNALVPAPGSLSATLLLEYEDRDLRAAALPGLLGVEKHVWLECGDLGRVPGDFDPHQIGDERVSSVQYVQFKLPPAHAMHWKALGMGGKLKLVVDHPRYQHEAVIPPQVAEALAKDLG